MIRIAINGFGRIGRIISLALNHPTIEVVASMTLPIIRQWLIC
jgi:glyceraldehyde-3-phosphate dehydrogenase/erythrose-4-phosphate dehydrogenase